MKYAARFLCLAIFFLATLCITIFGFVWTGQTDAAVHIRATLQAEITREAQTPAAGDFLFDLGYPPRLTPEAGQ